MSTEHLISLAPVAERVGTPETWREEHHCQCRPIIWDDGYGAPEAALVLDPTTTDLPDLGWRERAVILGFSMVMDGRYGSSWVAATYAKENWGIGYKELGLADDDLGESRRALFDTPTYYRFFGQVVDKPRVSRSMHMAPTISFDGSVLPTRRVRNVFGLKRDGMASCPVPKMIVTLKYFRNLFPRSLDLLFALYGLNDLDLYGGVDPTHVHVDGMSLVVSDSLARAWRHDDEALVGALADLYDAGLVAFVPADLADHRWYPAADPCVHYLGDSAASNVERFVVRPVFQVQQFAGAWAA